ncbi:hypothetical protein IKD49_02205 [Candidatus Saccharibacteria bacterium]|nr:hypothetical protein [Candidatus Saccharibacteria bacterium]MBR2994302.1 hypothetical protein [Candidatus Saccharibacteria bacterium]MBR2995060.1 hypothetical protein [Candidatus Saccharibacteria bacterium]
MGYLEEMLIRNGVIYHAPDGTSSYIEGSLVSNTLVVRDSSGWVTHRIERASNGVDLVVRNVSTGLVETRVKI